MLELISDGIQEYAKEIALSLSCKSPLDNQLMMENFVLIGEDIFKKAREIYNSLENRKKVIPICNFENEILSYIRWNMQKKTESVPQQSMDQIEQAEKIFIKECDEQIFLWLKDFLQCKFGKQVVLGKDWKTLFCGQITIEGKNTISLLGDDSMVENGLEISFMPIQRFKTNTLKSIWKLNEKYVSYRIFLWLENEGDIDIFTHLSFSGIKISGFCNNQSEGLDYFFNKPIVHVATVINESDIIIVYGKENNRYRQTILEKYLNRRALLLSYDELFVIGDQIYRKKVAIIYDSVKEAKRVVSILHEAGAEIVGGCALTNRTSDVFKNKTLSQKMISEGKYIVVLASAKTYCEETISNLKYNSWSIYVLSKDIFYSSVIITLWGKMALHLNNALKNKKKIVLYGTDSCYTNSWFTFFQTVGIECEKIFDDYENEKESIYSIFDVLYENIDDVFIIINKKIEEWENACDFLETLGFAFNKMYTGLYAVAYRHLPKLTDIMLGHVTLGLVKDAKYIGFRVYGEQENKRYKIVILGGSTTTSEAYRVPCWPQILYNIFQQKRKEVTIYNGAVDGYSASDELFKLIRDVRCLNPDLIISFSGVNNRFKTIYPYVSGYLQKVFEEVYGDNFCKGMQDNNMSPAQIWVQQEQMMAVISREVYHAKFICFAQPMYMSKNCLLPYEKLQFEKSDEAHKNDMEYRKQISVLSQKIEWMIDLQNYFDDCPSVYFDEAHVYEDGNQMIAEKVYEYIVDEIL